MTTKQNGYLVLLLAAGAIGAALLGKNDIAGVCVWAAVVVWLLA